MNRKKDQIPSASSPKAANNIKPDLGYPSQLEECILLALLGQERYGLEIIEILEKNSDGRLSPSVGTLYPTLQRLEYKNWITSRMEVSPGKSRARRKYFRITRTGSQQVGTMDRLRSDIVAHQA
jgi:DNA-binding PadR family transcriptional regulator